MPPTMSSVAVAESREAAAWSAPVALKDERATEALGAALAQSGRAGGLVFLRGNLGAGKTTTARGLLRFLGHQGNVKSPTYTLVEPYETLTPVVYHFDLYRLGDPEELEFMGFRDFLQGQALCLVEWPEKGEGWLASPDLELEIAPWDDHRQARWRAGTDKGLVMAESLKQLLMAASRISPAPESKGKSDDVL